MTSIGQHCQLVLAFVAHTLLNGSCREQDLMGCTKHSIRYSAILNLVLPRLQFLYAIATHRRLLRILEVLVLFLSFQIHRGSLG